VGGLSMDDLPDRSPPQDNDLPSRSVAGVRALAHYIGDNSLGDDRSNNPRNNPISRRTATPALDWFQSQSTSIGMAGRGLARCSLWLRKCVGFRRRVARNAQDSPAGV
jgi:hypothetical protein